MPFLAFEHAQQVERIEVIGCLGQDLAIYELSAIQLSTLVKC